MANIIELGQELLSYDNSLFTNAHDLVSSEPVVDGRARMEGLESSRHWNFKHKEHLDGSISFFRDETVVNNIVTALHKPSTIFDTSFYTNNPTKDIYSVVLVDELEGTEHRVVQKLHLEGNAIKEVKLPSPIPATKVLLQVGEGGLARFRILGTPLPPLPSLTNVLKGAKVLWFSDAAYGSPDLALREQREGKIMAGWESRRHSARHAIIVALNGPAVATKILIDTYMHCLNAFQFISILAAKFTNEETTNILSTLPKWKLTFPDGRSATMQDSQINEYFESNPISNVQYQQELDPHGPWTVLLPMSRLTRDTLHEFNTSKLAKHEPFTHLAFVGVPDGGVHRLVVFGDFQKL